MVILRNAGITSFWNTRRICCNVLCRPSSSTSIRCASHFSYTRMKVYSPASRAACCFFFRASLGLMPLAIIALASTRMARASRKLSSGYVPKDIRDRLPSHW